MKMKLKVRATATQKHLSTNSDACRALNGALFFVLSKIDITHTHPHDLYIITRAALQNHTIHNPVANIHLAF